MLPDERRCGYGRVCEQNAVAYIPRRLQPHGEALSLLEDLALRLTADAEVHEALGIVSLRLRDLDRAILELRRAISLEPTNSTTRYNLACALALAGQIEPALTALESAVVAGYSDSQHTRQDRDLESLRGLEQFEVLLERMSQR